MSATKFLVWMVIMLITGGLFGLIVPFQKDNPLVVCLICFAASCAVGLMLRGLC